jgi:hypothetical protein
MWSNRSENVEHPLMLSLLAARHAGPHLPMQSLSSVANPPDRRDSSELGECCRAAAFSCGPPETAAYGLKHVWLKQTASLTVGSTLREHEIVLAAGTLQLEAGFEHQYAEVAITLLPTYVWL